MKFIEEFKTFAMRGNVIDLAVWVVIWWAFWKIVSSLVSDIITPTIWVLAWWVDFTKLWYTLHNLKWEEVTIKYGSFIQTLFDFIIIAFSIFIIIKIINKAQEKVIKKAEKKVEKPKKADDVILLEEIRDLLKSTDSKISTENNEKTISIPKKTTRKQTK